MGRVELRRQRNVRIHEMTHEPPQQPTAAEASSALLALLLAPFLFPPPMISLVSVWSRAEFMLPDLPRPDRTLPDLSGGFPPFHF